MRYRRLPGVRTPIESLFAEKEMINYKEGRNICFYFLGRKEGAMEKLLGCRNLGFDCDFEACGESTDEALQITIDHARVMHGMKDFSERDRERVREEIRDAFCVPKGGYNPGGGALC